MTLIVLLILAVISLSGLFSEKGIFSRAENTGERYNEAKTREILETVLLTDGKYEKHSNPLYNQDDFLDNLIKTEIEGSNVNGDIVIIGEYAYELDRSVPKIGQYLGKTDNLTFPSLTLNKTIAENEETGTIEITTQEAENGITKIEIILKGKILETYKYDNIKEEIKESYTVNLNGEYTVKVYSKLKISKIINITELSGLSKDRSFLKIGDYVEYIPDIAENYIVPSSKTGTNSNSKEGIEQNLNLKWRIARINADGTIDLMSTTPVMTDLYLKGSTASINVIELLGDICKKQYSNNILEGSGFSLEIDFVNNINTTILKENLLNITSRSWLANKWSEGNYYQNWGVCAIIAR